MTDALQRLDRIIADDPAAKLWSFQKHTRGALHEVERIMTLKGEANSGIEIAAPNRPRSIYTIEVRRKQPQAMAPDAASIGDAPGTGYLCRFLKLLHLVNTQVPWAGKSFSANDSILRELTSNHLNLICGEENAKKYGGRLRAIIGSEMTPSNLCWISESPPEPACTPSTSVD